MSYAGFLLLVKLYNYFVDFRIFTLFLHHICTNTYQ